MQNAQQTRYAALPLGNRRSQDLLPSKPVGLVEVSKNLLALRHRIEMVLRRKPKVGSEIANSRSWELGVSSEELDIASKGQHGKLHIAISLIPLSLFLSSEFLAAITDMHRPTE
jgi:hypothetical protein